MPQPRQMESLKDECVRNIAANMDSLWCQHYVKHLLDHRETFRFILGPFEELPGDLIEHLIKHLNESGQLRRHHLDLLLVGQLKNLVVVRQLSASRSVNITLPLLASRCKMLQQLGLKRYVFPSKLLNEVFMSLPLLQVVNLSQTSVVDENLGTLACYCPIIRDLDLAFTKVTDDGISSLYQKLYVDTGQKEKPHISRSLKRLGLDGTYVTKAGIHRALLSMPNLEVLLHPALLSALTDLYKCRNIPPEELKDAREELVPVRQMKLRHLESDSFGMADDSVESNSISLAVKYCPKVASVNLNKLQNLSRDSLLPLLGLCCLTDLSLQCYMNEEDTMANFNSLISPVLSKHGERFLSLKLTCVKRVDIFMIARLCPYLKTLYLSLHEKNKFSQSNIIEAQEPGQPIFQTLKSLYIECPSDSVTEESDIIFTSGAYLKLVLKSPLLEEIVLIQQSQLTDEIILNTVGSTGLPNLKTLSLTECNNITSNSVWAIMLLKNPLMKMDLQRCANITRKDSERLQKYVTRRKLLTKMVWL